MRILVTGGAGFIGRWVVKLLLESQHQTVVLDNYSNSSPRNLAEFAQDPHLVELRGDVTVREDLDRVWAEHGPFDVVLHLAAQIRVQDSIDNPQATFVNDAVGTLEVLEKCRRQFFQQNGVPLDRPFHVTHHRANLKISRPRVVLMSTCMVYGQAGEAGIGEGHPTRAASPYAASKLAAEQLALSYYNAYGLPTKVIRPFNTYGPFQKRNMEGGVVAIFIARDLQGEPLLVKGDGTQTRDLLYVEDCARFVIAAGLSDAGDGEILNAGLGDDIAIRDLAALVADRSHGGNGVDVRHMEHDHPQAEIQRLRCDSGKADRLLGWKPKVGLKEGIQRTRRWIALNPHSI